MKAFMITDLEGPAMVTRIKNPDDPDETAALKTTAMTLLTAEVNAAVDGILDAEPDAEVVVWDAHGSGGIDGPQIHERAMLIARGPIRPPYFLDASFDAVYFVGQHAMACTENAPMCHTYNGSIEYYKINGQRVGEFGARAMMAATLGVPTVMIAGDDKAVAEAQAMLPAIYGVPVKWGLGPGLVKHLSPPAARQRIRQAACEATRNRATIPRLEIHPPYEQEIRVKEGQGIGYLLEWGAERIDERTVRRRSNSICDLRV